MSGSIRLDYTEGAHKRKRRKEMFMQEKAGRVFVYGKYILKTISSFCKHFNT